MLSQNSSRESEPITSLTNAVVLVTGANGGIGTEFVRGVLARGAAKVYATARRPREWNDARIGPLTLDVTDADSIADAVAAAGDVTVLINNAGSLPQTASMLEVTDAGLRQVMRINFLPVHGSCSGCLAGAQVTIVRVQTFHAPRALAGRSDTTVGSPDR